MSGAEVVPDGLSERSGALWAEVLAEYELSAAELEVLRGALEALDRADEAARVLKADGLVSVDRYGSPKQHPLLDIEQRCRTQFRQSVAQLGVKLTAERRDSPTTTRARAAANARWSRERAQ